jgi:hypothetical protein
LRKWLEKLNKKRKRKKKQPQLRLVAFREHRWRVTFRLIRDVAGTGTEFSRQDRKCFENKTPSKQKTSNAWG